MRKYGYSALLASLLLLSLPGQGDTIYSYNDTLGFSSEDTGTGAYLGVDIDDISTERVAALKLKDEHGVEVTLVDQDAPAGKAGLKEHDVILTMNGTTVDSGAQLRRMIHETPAGRVVTLGVSRDGQPLTLKVQLADKGKEMARAKDWKFEMPAMPPMPRMADLPSVVVVHSSARSGLSVENITPQLGLFFGVKNGKGVLVRSVEKGSLAEKAGLRAGDVIVKLNGQPVNDTSDFTHSLRSRGASSVSVGVVRDKKEQSVTLNLPERKETGRNRGIPEDFNIDIDADIDLGDLQDELAKLQPEIEFAVTESRRKMRELQPKLAEEAREAAKKAMKELDAHRGELEQAQRELKKHAEEMKQQMQEQQRELLREQKKLQREWGEGQAEI